MIPAVPDFGIGPAPEPGRVDEVAPGVLRLTAPNPGLMTGPGTNTYLVGRAEPVVVDPGPADESHTAAIVAAAAPLGPVRTIVVTHTHVDHAPGAAALAAATGARVVGYGPAEGFDARRARGRGVVAGLSRTRRRPAHAARAAHAGPRVGPPVLAGRGARAAVHRRPRHARLDGRDPPARRRPAPVPRQPGPRARRGAAHPHPRPGPRPADGPRARRGRRADRPPARPPRARRGRAAPGAARATVDELLGEVYGDVTERQLPVARFSLWAHLRALGQEGRATALDAAPGEDTIESRWAAA